MKNNKILQLFITFLKIGAFTFGGGYAMIALLENEFVEKKKWMTKEEFLDMTAIAESTPGPIAINSATHIGCKTAGIIGGAVATLAVCIPSFTIIYIISLFLDKFLEFQYVGYAFKGIQACVVYLILSAGIKVLKGLKKNALNYIIVTAVIVAMTVLSFFSIKFSTIYYILLCGAVGIIVFFATKRGGDNK